MINEELERMMQFIVEQQANFSASLEQSKQESAEYNAEVNARLDRVDLQIRQLVESASILRDAIIGLTHHVERHDENIKSHEREMAEIRRANAERVELGKEMDARLNTLMLVVERHINDHQ